MTLQSNDAGRIATNKKREPVMSRERMIHVCTRCDFMIVEQVAI